MLDAIDLTDLDTWVRAVKYDAFGPLRREAPVAGPGIGPGAPPPVTRQDEVAPLVLAAVGWRSG